MPVADCAWAVSVPNALTAAAAARAKARRTAGGRPASSPHCRTPSTYIGCVGRIFRPFARTPRGGVVWSDGTAGFRRAPAPDPARLEREPRTGRPAPVIRPERGVVCSKANGAGRSDRGRSDVRRRPAAAGGPSISGARDHAGQQQAGRLGGADRPDVKVEVLARRRVGLDQGQRVAVARGEHPDRQGHRARGDRLVEQADVGRTRVDRQDVLGAAGEDRRPAGHVLQRDGEGRAAGGVDGQPGHDQLVGGRGGPVDLGDVPAAGVPRLGLRCAGRRSSRWRWNRCRP